VVETLPASGWWTGGSLIAGGLIALATIVVSLVQARRTRKLVLPAPRRGESYLPVPSIPATTRETGDQVPLSD
jgi:TRAP-type C4-dicarboxylate transport system permease small subunit